MTTVIFFVVKVPLSSVEKGQHKIYLCRTQIIGLLHYLPLLMEAMEASTEASNKAFHGIKANSAPKPNYQARQGVVNNRRML